MNRWIALGLALFVTACKRREEPKRSNAETPPPIRLVETARTSDPDGTNACPACNVKLRGDVCRYCGRPIDPRPAPDGTPSFACPKEGCPYTAGRPEKCLSHPDTDLREQWFVCACGRRQVHEGVCPTCGRNLQRELR